MYRNVLKCIETYRRISLSELIGVYPNLSELIRLILIGSDWFRLALIDSDCFRLIRSDSDKFLCHPITSNPPKITSIFFLFSSFLARLRFAEKMFGRGKKAVFGKSCNFCHHFPTLLAVVQYITTLRWQNLQCLPKWRLTGFARFLAHFDRICKV